MDVLRFNFSSEDNRNSVSAIMVNEGYIVQNTNPQPGSYVLNIYIINDDAAKSLNKEEDKEVEVVE